MLCSVGYPRAVEILALSHRKKEKKKIEHHSALPRPKEGMRPVVIRLVANLIMSAADSKLLYMIAVAGDTDKLLCIARSTI